MQKFSDYPIQQQAFQNALETEGEFQSYPCGVIAQSGDWVKFQGNHLSSWTRRHRVPNPYALTLVTSSSKMSASRSSTTTEVLEVSSSTKFRTMAENASVGQRSLSPLIQMPCLGLDLPDLDYATSEIAVAGGHQLHWLSHIRDRPLKIVRSGSAVSRGYRARSGYRVAGLNDHRAPFTAICGDNSHYDDVLVR